MANQDRLLSVAEAAEILGVTRARVNQLVSGGRIPAQRIGRSFAIRQTDLKLVETRKVGRPPKKSSSKSDGGK